MPVPTLVLPTSVLHQERLRMNSSEIITRHYGIYEVESDGGPSTSSVENDQGNISRQLQGILSITS